MSERVSKVQAAIDSGQLTNDQIRQTFEETKLSCAKPEYIEVWPGRVLIGISFCELTRKYEYHLNPVIASRYEYKAFPTATQQLAEVCATCPVFAQTLTALAAKVK